MTDEERREKEKDLQALYEVKDTFATPGWAHLVATFRNSIKDYTAEVMAAIESTPKEVERRGRVRVLDWFLKYPEDVETQIKDLKDELADSESEQPVQ